MSFKVLVLTTNTSHHSYFVGRLVEAGYETHVLEETRSTILSSEQKNFHADCEDYETHRWFSGVTPLLRELCPVESCDSINAPETLRFLSSNSYDVTVAFGVGLIRIPAFSQLSPLRLNLHGGDPQRYRGLDSHLWSIYHRDLGALVTTLHMLNERLDDGDIVAAGSLDLGGIENLHQVRSINTEMAVDLTLGTFATISAVGRVISYPQTSIGRYYSEMPDELLRLCRTRFERLIRDSEVT